MIISLRITFFLKCQVTLLPTNNKLRNKLLYKRSSNKGKIDFFDYNEC